MKSATVPSAPKTSPIVNHTSKAKAGQQGQAENKRSTPPKPRTPAKQSPPRAKAPFTPSAPPSATGAHFCSSAFLNSPDPSSLPLPLFDDDLRMNELSAISRALPVTA